MAALVLVALVIGLLLSAFPRATMAFGDSHDGRNAGVWAEHGRSLREVGPLASRMGTLSLVGDRVTPYATHPPLIGLEIALAEAVLGERPWVTRLPAWGGSLASVVLAFLLLRACRLRPVAAAIGVTVGFGGPMFAVYGTMLDTAMVGLPFGLAVLWLWQRGCTGRAAPTPVVALVCVLAALTSWLGLMTVVLVCGATAVARVRGRKAARLGGSDAGLGDPAVGFFVGALAGVVLVVSWIGWAYGSLAPLLDQFVLRTGEGAVPVGLGWLIGALRDHWSNLFTVGQLVVAVPALVAAVQWRATRAVAAVSLVSLAVWIGGLRSGALHHDYWGYWLIVPLALGVGVMAESILATLAHRSRLPSRVRSAGPLAMAAGATVVALAGVLVPNSAATWAEEGAEAGAAVLAASYPTGQRESWYVGAIILPAEWITYNSDRPATELRTATDLERLAATAPDELVVVSVRSLPSDLRSPGANRGCRLGVPAGRAVVVASAGDLVAGLQSSGTDCLA